MKPGNRQCIDMVPIHAKRLLWKMGERFCFIMPFCHSAERHFVFGKKNDFT